MSLGHPITQSSDEHWYGRMKRQAKKIEQEDAAPELQGPDGGTIARLRAQLKRLDPKDEQYKAVAQELTRAYAAAYPGFEEDPAT